MARRIVSKENKSSNWMLCINAVKWIPVLFILSIVVWSYFAYVIQLCLMTIEEPLKRIIYLVIYHLILIMFLWTYYRTTYTRIGIVPKEYKLPDSELDRLMHAENEEIQNFILTQFSRDLPNHNRTIHGGVRYCEKCCQVKPDRAHHCSVCGVCVLKMDHHCPWVNNCVCFTNYKYFILFLGYALLYCIFITLSSFEFFVQYWSNHDETTKSDSLLLDNIGKFHILFLFFVSVMFAISLASLFFYHMYLASVNRTTLEAFRAPVFTNGPDKNGFNLGRKENFRKVFGTKCGLWFIPIFSSIGDGAHFDIRASIEETKSLLGSSRYEDD